MIRRLVVLAAVCLAVGALSTTVGADPGKSPVFGYETFDFEITAADGAFNPCAGIDPTLVVEGTFEIYDHSFERGNGSHSNANFWISGEDSHGFVLRRTNVGPDVTNVNVSNGVMTFSSIGQFHWQHPETKQRYHFQALVHMTDVGGTNVVMMERFEFSDCLGPRVNGA